MISPEALAVLHRLIAILLALLDALASPVDGKPRALLTRLAIRALSAHLERVAAHLAETADSAASAPPPPSPRLEPRTIHKRPAPRPILRTPVHPRRTASPGQIAPRAKIEHLAHGRLMPTLFRNQNK